jgi:hypothetical protein
MRHSAPGVTLRLWTSRTAANLELGNGHATLNVSDSTFKVRKEMR